MALLRGFGWTIGGLLFLGLLLVPSESDGSNAAGDITTVLLSVAVILAGCLYLRVRLVVAPTGIVVVNPLRTYRVSVSAARSFDEPGKLVLENGNQLDVSALEEARPFSPSFAPSPKLSAVIEELNEYLATVRG